MSGKMWVKFGITPTPRRTTEELVPCSPPTIWSWTSFSRWPVPKPWTQNRNPRLRFPSGTAAAVTRHNRTLITYNGLIKSNNNWAKPLWGPLNSAPEVCVYGWCVLCTWLSSNGVQNLDVTELINLEKLNDPDPYLQTHTNYTSRKHTRLKLLHYNPDFGVLSGTYTLNRYSHRARTKSHARGWPISLRAIDPMVAVASCFRIIWGFSVYSRYLDVSK